MHQRPLVLTILTIQFVGSLLSTTATLLSQEPYTPEAAAGVILTGLLLLLYWQGWEPARLLSAIAMSIAVGFNTPEPFVSSEASITVLWPPIIALITTGPLGILLSALGTIGVLIVRAGGGNYAHPLFLSLYAMLVGGMMVSRLAFDLEWRRAEQARRLAEDQARELEQQQVLLRESERRYRLIAENTSDIICMLDEQARFVYASPSFQTMLGFAPADLLGQMAFEQLHPLDQELIAVAWQAILAGQPAPTTFRYRHADGSWHWFEARGTRIEENEHTYAIFVGIDITLRRKLEAQLVQAQKMEGIGRLAGGIAHDFNNLLTAIGGYTELALSSLPPEEPAAADMREIRRSVERATRLTRQLLTFSRRQLVEPRLFNLNDLIIDMDNLLRRLIGEHIDLVTHLSPELANVQADPGHFEQVIVNLAVNARDAMPEGGRLIIETANVLLDEAYTLRHAQMAPGTYVMLAVSDTGTGIAEEHLPHLFEPFFTTKASGEGTGLGLATCYGIVHQSSGHIFIYSEVGLGTTVRIYLPQIAGKPIPLLHHLPDPVKTRGIEHILVVEDDPQLREMVVRVLNDHGYLVLSAENGNTALSSIGAKTEATSLDLLLTDMVMPQMNGPAVALKLLAYYPDLKVLYMSGYADMTIAHNSTLEPGGAFLPKPFTPLMLAQKVREVLDA